MGKKYFLPTEAFLLILCFISSLLVLLLFLLLLCFIRRFPCDYVTIDVPHLSLVSAIHLVYCPHIQLTMLVTIVCSTMFVFAELRPMLCYYAHRNVHLNPGEMHLQPESILNLTMKARCIRILYGSCVVLFCL